MSELKYLANGLPVIVLEAGSGDAPYDDNGVANPAYRSARVATFATVEEVEDAQLHDTPPAPVDTGTSPDPAALQAQLAALSEQLQRLTAQGVAAPAAAPAEAPATALTPPVTAPAEVVPAPALEELSTEQLQAALAERQQATQQG